MSLYPIAVLVAVLAFPAYATNAACTQMANTQAYDLERICASSALSPQSGNRYDVSAMQDGDLRTAWCEGAAGNGVGSEIIYEWENAAALERVMITNGYAKSDSVWNKNGRVRAVTVITWAEGSNGDNYDRFQRELRNTSREQSIEFPGLRVPLRKMTIRIDSVYPGSKWQDTCISEIWTDFGM